MKIALAQCNPIVGDISGNSARILEYYRRACDTGAELVVFPELALTGCPPFDLLRREFFLQSAMDALQSLASSAGAVPLVLGSISLEEGGLYNAGFVLADGGIAHRVYKRSHTVSDVFDDRRYFSLKTPQAEPWLYAGEKISFSICQPVCEGAALRGSPIFSESAADARGAHREASLIINLAATPYTHGIVRRRRDMARSLAEAFSCPCVHVEQVGGNGEFIFDGGSLAAFPNRDFVECAHFAEDLRIVDTTRSDTLRADLIAGNLAHLGHEEKRSGPCSDGALAELHAALVFGLKEYVRKCGFDTVLLGLSGGLDSAVLAALAAHALGPEKVVGVAMPSRHSSQGSVDDARALARALGIRMETLPIEAPVQAYEETFAALFAGTESGLAEENLQARIRGTLLMTLSNKFSWLLLNTGNKSEFAAGYCTLYGDMTGALAVLGDVYKTRLYALARWINREREIIPQATIGKPPSAELAPGQKDSDSLPPYEILDEILELYLEGGLDADAITARGHDAQLVCSVVALVERNEYKRRQAAPVLRLSARAFGPGRHFPLASKPVFFP